MAIGDLNPGTWRLEVYEVKPSSPTAGLITDLSNLYTSDLTITKQRNYPDEIKFTLDLQQLEERAKALGVLSRDILEPYKHRICCYRNNKFMAQGIVVKTTANLNNQSKNTLEVHCVDTLGLLEKRLIHQDYGEGSWADFAKEVVYDAQHEPNRIYNYAWEGDGTSIDNAWFRGWKYTPGESALRDFPEWEPNHLYSMYDTCTHDAKFWEAKEHAFYSGETFSESNWTLLGILDQETGDVAGVYGVWREDDEEPGPTGTALGGWGGTSSCHMTAQTFTVNNAGSITGISMANSQISTSLVSPYLIDSKLPSIYQEVEYIESSGSQWIDTNFTPTVNTKIQMKFMNLETTGKAILGALNSLNDKDDYRFFNASNVFYFDVPGTGQYGARIYGGSCPSNLIHEVEIGNFYIKFVNGASNIVSSTTQNFVTSGTLALNTYSSKSFISKNRWYYVRIYENDVLVRNLTPCYRKSDKKVGLYDTVGKIFYTNAGLGEFSVGKDATNSPRLPREYVEIQYLENTYGISDAAQLSPLIDTGLNARDYGERLKIDTVVQFNPNTSTTIPHCIASVSRGVYNGTFYWNPQFNFCLADSGRAWLEYSTSSATYNASMSTIQAVAIGSSQSHLILDATLDKPSLSVDGTVYIGTTARASNSKYGPSANITLFARNFQNPENVDKHRNGSYGAPMKLYYMRIYSSSGELLRDFVPCLRAEDAKPGLYDMQHGVFYQNANSSAVGDFTAGPVVPYDTTFELTRDRRFDTSMGDYRAIQGIDTETLQSKFAETYPNLLASGYAPNGIVFIGVSGGYTCTLTIGPIGTKNGTYQETIWSGTTIESAASPLAEWGLTIFKTSVWE